MSNLFSVARLRKRVFFLPPWLLFGLITKRLDSLFWLEDFLNTVSKEDEYVSYTLMIELGVV